MALQWGIDLGGTKLEGVVVDPERPTAPLCRVRVDTEAHGGYEHILSRFAALRAEMVKCVGTEPRAIGIGTPGILDPKTLRLKNSNTQCLNGESLREDLARVLKCGVALANDANLFALAESTYGAAKGGETCFGVILGTGVGGGIVLRGAIHTGAHGIAGEWGHNVLVNDGVPCPCGKRGCVERYISGPALESFYFERSGTARRLVEIEERASSGEDPHARETIDRLVRYFGEAIATVVNILDPDVIVLGGGVSHIDRLYVDGRAALLSNLFHDRFEARLVRNELGDSAGVFGAAALSATIP